MKTLTLAVGFAAGYVLGSRAGRERYQQIVDKVSELGNKPAVAEATAKAKGLLDHGTRAVTDKVDNGPAQVTADARAARPRRTPTATPVNGTAI